MAALSSGSYCCVHSKSGMIKNRRSTSQVLVLWCCQNRKPIHPSRITQTTKKDKQRKQQYSLLSLLIGGLRKLGNNMKENLSPKAKQKGDWKDLILMSFSFAVYVYVSQLVVSAYFVWMMSSPKPQW